jgi:hypothetical protein
MALAHAKTRQAALFWRGPHRGCDFQMCAGRACRVARFIFYFNDL